VRLTACALICRDGYFSTLKVNIEAMARREKKKVVVLGHSMGNRIIQYFLNWVRTTIHWSATCFYQDT
jgi:triacylglycerol esterase/lipase EstA (alpha/beta hydrolase family)